MKPDLATVPLWSVVRIARDVVDPITLGDQIMHYSIPSVDAFGGPQIEEAAQIKSAKLRMRGGEVLISKLNPRKSRVIRVIPDELPIVSSTEFVGLLAKEELEPRFLAYFLQSEPVRQELDSRVQSVTRSHQRVDPSDITHLEICLQTLEEQRRIADFLDKETDRNEQLATRRRRQLSLLNEYAFAHMSESLVPGILSNARGSQPWPWLPELPERLPLVRLGYLCKLQNGFTLDSNRQVGKDVVTRPYLRVANVQAGALALDEVSEVTIPRSIAARCTLKRGDVLMTEGGDLDKLGRGTVWRGEIPNCLHQNHVFALRPNKDRLHSDYLALMTQTLHGRCYFESTGVKTTNLASTNSSKILSFPIPLPDLETQIGLSTQLLADLQAIENTKDAIRRQLDLLAERKQTLITAAVTGQIDVTTARGVDVS